MAISGLRSCLVRRAANFNKFSKLTPRSMSYLSSHRAECKPPVPYLVGTVLRAKRHIPVANPQSISITDQQSDEIRSAHPLELCFRHPPAGFLLEHEVLRLLITEEVRVGDNEHAQLFKVSLLSKDAKFERLSPSPSPQLLAKVYDPLYEEFDDNLGPFPFLSTAQEYFQETQAYAQMSDLYDRFVPRYYGSYQIEVYQKETPRPRRVQMILIEMLPGSALSSLDPERFNQTQRQGIMASVIEAESNLIQQGIWHGDLFDRNVVWLPADGCSRGMAKIIDFGQSGVFSRTKCPPEGLRLCSSQELLSSIVNRCLVWNTGPRNFDCWVDWEWESWIKERAWLAYLPSGELDIDARFRSARVEEALIGSE